MAKYRRKTTTDEEGIFEAEQWFPGQKVKGVCEGSCYQPGGRAPHVHLAENVTTPAEPGNWIMPATDSRYFMSRYPEVFEACFELVEESAHAGTDH